MLRGGRFLEKKRGPAKDIKADVRKFWKETCMFSNSISEKNIIFETHVMEKRRNMRSKF
jgi:hypothetical protein